MKYGRASRAAWLIGLALAVGHWPAQVCGQAVPAPPRATAAESSSSAPASSPLARSGSAPVGQAGGGAQADFDTLIDLIESTVAPDSWETVGGDGTIQGFPGGVYVDPRGVLRQVSTATAARLADHWQTKSLRERHADAAEPLAVESRSPLRKVSLRGWLAAWETSQATAQGDWSLVPEEIRLVAGLERIDWLAWDAPRQDVIIAGPAGGWMTDRQGRVVSRAARRPVLRLEDWVTLCHNVSEHHGRFLCAITPTDAGLAAAQQYANAAAVRPLPVGAKQRATYLEGLREALGLQRVEFAGIPAGSRVARVLLEADHHMKQIGIGLQPGTPLVPSYLQRVGEAGGAPEQMAVLRWWFTLEPNAVEVLATGREPTFRFRDRVVRVLSENELLTEQGQRVHTGQSDPHNADFAADFTQDFAALATKYPVYADLDNLFRWALVASFLSERSAVGDQAQPASAAVDRSRLEQGNDWGAALRAAWAAIDVSHLPTARVPQWVPSIVNEHRVDRRRFLAAVSGGVQFTPRDVALDSPRSTSKAARPPLTAAEASPASASARWWWD